VVERYNRSSDASGCGLIFDADDAPRAVLVWTAGGGCPCSLTLLVNQRARFLFRFPAV